MPVSKYLSLLAVVLSAPVAAAQSTAPADASEPAAVRPLAVEQVSASDVADDVGNAIRLRWSLPPGQPPEVSYEIERRASGEPVWSVAGTAAAGSTAYVDAPMLEGKPELRNGVPYDYRVVAAAGDERTASAEVQAVPEASLVHTGRLASLGFLLGFFALILWLIRRSRRGKEMYIRPIAGLKALEEAVGRATEMGKPVFFMPGIDDTNNIQTLYGMVILQHVTKLVAQYETPLIVAVGRSFVVPLAQETVRQGYMDAGRVDLYQPDTVRFFSDEQFATVTAVAGIFLREKPATNLYFGSFYAESLILAETGFLSGSIQIAGTGNIHQLPFFVVACDYTLIGEEFFAVSAYLSKDPKLLGSLKALDLAKAAVTVGLVLGVLAASFNYGWGDWLQAVLTDEPPWTEAGRDGLEAKAEARRLAAASDDAAGAGGE